MTPGRNFVSRNHKNSPKYLSQPPGGDENLRIIILSGVLLHWAASVKAVPKMKPYKMQLSDFMGQE